MEYLLFYMSLSEMMLLSAAIVVLVLLAVNWLFSAVSSRLIPGYYMRRRSTGLYAKLAVFVIFMVLLAGIGQAAYPLFHSVANLSFRTLSMLNGSITSVSGALRSAASPQGVQPEVINASWASEFLANASAMRGLGYSACPNLSALALSRFESMTNGTNYMIYGGTINGTAPRGEVVLHPGQSSPSEYAQSLPSTMAAQWMDMASWNYSYAGFHAGYAPTVTPSASCNAPDPSAGQNLQQLYLANGCNVTVSRSALVVIELSRSCPQSESMASS